MTHDNLADRKAAMARHPSNAEPPALSITQIDMLLHIGVLDLVRGLLRECGGGDLDDMLTQLTNKVRFDPAVRQFTIDYQRWVDEAPYGDLDHPCPEFDNYL
jgi:hypothetical protein